MIQRIQNVFGRTLRDRSRYVCNLGHRYDLQLATLFCRCRAALAQNGRKILLLLVGPSPLLPEILRRAQGAEPIVRIEGTIPHEEIMRYYMATDVGLYTVDDSPNLTESEGRG